jgi:hypothetical protein
MAKGANYDFDLLAVIAVARRTDAENALPEPATA